MSSQIKTYDPVILYRWLLPLASFTIPLHNRLNVIVLLVLLVVWLFDGSPTEKFRRIKSAGTGTKLVVMTGIYFLYVFGMLYSNDPASGFFNLEVKLSLLLIPLVYASMNRRSFNGRVTKDIAISFIAGTFLSTLICLGKAIFEYMNGEGTYVFYYSYLSFYHHASYLAMYIAFSLVLIWFLFFDGQKFPGTPITLLFILLSLYLSAFIVMLSSKAGILGLFGALVYIAVHVFFFEKSRRKGLSVLLAGLIAVFSLLWIFPNAVHRIESVKDSISDEGPGISQEGSGDRIYIWKAALEVVKQNWILGVGTGDVQNALNDMYLDQGNEYAASQDLNAHNQYLQTLIAIGLPGLLILMLMLVYPMRQAFSPGLRPYLFMILIFAGNLLFESMLEKQAGVVFYAFFNSVYLLGIQESEL